MKKINRRSFMALGALTLGTLGHLKQGGLFFAEALGANPDDGIKLLKYIHAITTENLPKQAKRHLKQIQKFFKKNPLTAKANGVTAETALPQCKYCRFYITDGVATKDYGKCKHVAKKAGQLVYKDAWCTMFNVNKKKNDKKLKKA